MTIAIFLGSLLAAMAIGVPIAFALLISGVALMYHLAIFDTQIIAQNLINGADNFVLLAVPFFVLAGELMNRGGISERLIHLAQIIVGRIRGGSAYAAILAAIMFSGISGTAVADIAALGQIFINGQEVNIDNPRDANKRRARAAFF